MTPADVLNTSEERRVGGSDLLTLTGSGGSTRWSPTTPGGTSSIHVDPYERLVEALHHVKWHLDGTLTFRRSCAHGIWRSDAMVINGRNALAVLVRDVPKVTIEPIRGLRVLKDLVVDMEPFFDGYREVLLHS